MLMGVAGQLKSGEELTGHNHDIPATAHLATKLCPVADCQTFAPERAMFDCPSHLDGSPSKCRGYRTRSSSRLETSPARRQKRRGLRPRPWQVSANEGSDPHK